MTQKNHNPVRSQSFALKFYEGYKSRERPAAIIIGDQEIKIKKIIWRKRIRDYKSGAQREVFLCETENDRLKLTVFSTGKFIIEFTD